MWISEIRVRLTTLVPSPNSSQLEPAHPAPPAPLQKKTIDRFNIWQDLFEGFEKHQSAGCRIEENLAVFFVVVKFKFARLLSVKN